MPKVTIEFILPEEECEYNIVTKASKMYQCLWDIDNELRGYLKHGHTFKSADELAEYIRNEILNNINFDEF